MSELTVDRFMTHCPHTIGHDQPPSAAHEMMRRHGVRHLPVLEGGKRALSMQLAERRTEESSTR